ncbi:NADPH-dependent FMN reductase [Chitinophaga vietnamensis]|uniref:NADPH-dependent FMN reductase n=1 Tax=Chitinophaga vietnamensis TaxID=2593957 RepID=UPI001375EB3A|nr:NAD(P)H-dependent oxidoreductase [Chitinophaga vietnamensis]
MLAGSNSQQSINQSLAATVAGMLPAMEHTLLSLRDFPLPMYSPDEEKEQGIPENVFRLKEILDSASGLVVAVPEHNGSVPAFFKNTLDWISRAARNYRILSNKPVLLLSASPGGGGTIAITHAEVILQRLGATITGKFTVSYFFQHAEIHQSAAVFKEPALQEQLAAAVAQFVDHLKMKTA